MGNKKNNNPFETIVKIYEDCVKKGNKKNNPEIYKQCMKILKYGMEHISSYKLKETKIHVTDVKYLDGYFIFGMGDNSVVHFKIKELPGWLFGVWWDPIDKKSKSITGHWFTQYEKDIDKFKPAASEIKADFSINPNATKEQYSVPWEIEKHLTFMLTEPILARGRNLCSFDYNYEYYSRSRVKRIVNKHDRDEKKYQIGKIRAIKRVKRLLTRICIDDFENREFTIVDHGDHCSPRLEVYVPESHFGLEPGYYGDAFSEENMKRLDKLLTKLSKKTYWGIYDCGMNVVPDAQYKKIKKLNAKSIDK